MPLARIGEANEGSSSWTDQSTCTGLRIPGPSMKPVRSGLPRKRASWVTETAAGVAVSAETICSVGVGLGAGVWVGSGVDVPVGIGVSVSVGSAVAELVAVSLGSGVEMSTGVGVWVDAGDGEAVDVLEG
jgi:hypothetical protein